MTKPVFRAINTSGGAFTGGKRGAKMMTKLLAMFFPLKKVRRYSKHLLFAAVVLVGTVAVYHEMVTSKAWSIATSMYPDAHDGSDKWEQGDHQPNAAWSSSYIPQTWKPEYKGRANLHAFEDWCGGSTADLFRNRHYPLHPHSRTTVQKLAVSPQWTDYGLRIFGYLHPFADGKYVFSLSSDDNSDFWLSTDDSPLNTRLLAWVGKTGTEWTAPGEFDKYASQTSKPVRLSARRKYFFELIHKQKGGADHVEVAWQLEDRSVTFRVIDSSDISLYVDESALLISDVAHIPQTVASHQQTPTKQQHPAADMLREDPRDTIYRLPLINSQFLQGVLPDCSYKPSYTIKDFPLQRYQGLQFVHMSYIYPNDYTRLTHMEKENSCFYRERPHNQNIRYMTLDRPDKQDIGETGQNLVMKKSPLYDEDEFGKETYGSKSETMLAEMDDAFLRDYGDEIDDYARSLRRKLFQVAHPAQRLKRKRKSLKTAMRPRQSNSLKPEEGEQLNTKERLAERSEQLNPKQQSTREINSPLNTTVAKQWSSVLKDTESRVVKLNPKGIDAKKALRIGETEIKKPLLDKAEYKIDKDKDHGMAAKDSKQGKGEQYDDYPEEKNQKPSNLVFDSAVKWSQTFQFNRLDLQSQRSDSINLHCTLLGNLLIQSSEAMSIVEDFMYQLNKKHNRQFTLVRVLNVVKRVDWALGNRYLVELEVKDASGKLLRLSHYIYSLSPNSRQRSKNSSFQRVKPAQLLCNPVGFRWNPAATIHFIVPVKNQARWVYQLIENMEDLFRETGDTNFNLIITDYSSTDMDVEKALRNSSLHRYQYVKLSGNFERSGGLQAGVNLIKDDHSIVFLCDLHLHFPPSIIDTTRKHCVEGYMAFTPILMRLDCGATPLDARGFWEVNGFGLLGIYKSDLDVVGGMNTREFKDRWGGEDWELLDRVLQAGLEVDRIYVRNFFHYFHSKRGMWNRRVSRHS